MHVIGMEINKIETSRNTERKNPFNPFEALRSTCQFWMAEPRRRRRRSTRLAHTENTPICLFRLWIESFFTISCIISDATEYRFQLYKSKSELRQFSVHFFFTIVSFIAVSPLDFFLFCFLAARLKYLLKSVKTMRIRNMQNECKFVQTRSSIRT